LRLRGSDGGAQDRSPRSETARPGRPIRGDPDERKEPAMTRRETPSPSGAGDPDQQRSTRRAFVTKAAAAGAALGASPVLATPAKAAYRARRAKGKVVIGAFVDGGLVPFKNKIIPLFERDTGIKVEFLQDDYSTFFEKAFQDGLTKAGQFDIYVMDDPWIPQYASAPVLQNLSK